MAASQTITATKRCPRCEASKGEQEFSPQAVYCKSCAAAYKREQRVRNPERVREQERRYHANRTPEQRERDREQRRAWRERRRDHHNAKNRESHVRVRYGLTMEEYEAKLAGGCAICGSEEGVGIDHCHATGRVRDALCRRCNLALGYLGDDPTRARAAVDYLERHSVPELREVS